MSSPTRHDARSTVTNYATLAARFRPIFAKIAQGTVERERTRTLPYAEIDELKRAGFGAVRVPVEQGGAGASIPQLFRLLAELAAADSNLPQALRGHFAFVEDKLNAPADSEQRAWFDRFASGQLVGNAWTEAGDVALGQIKTKVSQRGGAWVLNGAKFYSTGSLYADWIDVFAQREADGSDAIVAVNVHQPGVIREDDWDGFGQTTTGSGTTRFENATVEPRNIIDFSARFAYQTAFYQLFHVATLAGIAEGATREVAALVRNRTRVYSHGNASHVSGDAQIQQVVGEIASWAFGAHAAGLSAAEAAQRAYESHFDNDVEAERAVNVEAEIASAQSQLVASELTLRATTHLFDALGASATRVQHALDRHWRNARTVSSHNPLVYKAKIVGDWVINGTPPPFVWQIGNGQQGNAPQGEGKQA